ncbi:hypothetical protein CK203_111908 [Vitis vinifera]|uniref:Uncharacterized protein n=1 Tax=Vitis vinifera TaxID=29760 RepID=A0A438CC86_VITVI|nr:hypothetical protein CK203_111908 [Vitis vinifera]
MAKLLEAQINEETKLWSLIVLCLSRSKYARKEQWREENRVKKTEDSSCSLPSHFWSTSQSPFSTYHIPFQSLGSKESNASNRVRFRAEMRKIWPSEGNCIKLRDNFAPCEIGTSTQTTSEDVFPEDERLNFWFLGVKEARKSSDSISNLEAITGILPPPEHDMPGPSEPTAPSEEVTSAEQAIPSEETTPAEQTMPHEETTIAEVETPIQSTQETTTEPSSPHNPPTTT